jgi:hypothetical protein
MNWKYRPEFQAFPGVKLSYGKAGITTDLINGNSLNSESDVDKDKLINRVYKPYDAAHEIKSSQVSKLTSSSLLELKELILVASASREITLTLLKKKTELKVVVEKKLKKCKSSIFKSFYKKRILRFEEQIVLLNEEIEELTAQLSLSVINLEVDTEDVYYELYKNMCEAFRLLATSKKKWDFTSSQRTNKIIERTSATNTITRSEIELSEKILPILYTNEPVPFIKNINGGDIYLFPAFMIFYESREQFALVDYADVQISHRITSFIESEKVPEDAKVIDYTWFKVNKNGSPDKRFANNYQIPIAEYGEISIRSSTGVNELYCFSNREYTDLFYKSIHDYADSLKLAKELLNSF